ncbi:MAG: hypothetical protein AAGI72_15455 [Pseudomonadota bacterium]
MSLFVQSRSAVSSTTVTLDAPATAGNLLMYICADNNVSQTLTPAGFTTLRSFNGGGAAVRANIVVAIKEAAGGEQTITNGGATGPRPSTIVVEYTNVDIASIVSAIAQGWAASEVSPFTASVASPAANTLALAIYAGEALSTANFSPHPAADMIVRRRAAATNAPAANWPGVGLAESSSLFAAGEDITLGWTTSPADNRKTVVVVALPPVGGDSPIDIPGSAQDIAVTTHPGAVSIGRQIAANLAAIDAQAHPGIISLGASLGAAVKQIEVLTPGGSVSSGSVINGQAKSIVVDALVGQVSAGTTIGAVVKQIDVQPHSGAVQSGNQLSGGAAGIDVTTYAGQVELAITIQGSLADISVEALAGSLGLGTAINAVAQQIELTPYGGVLTLGTNLFAQAQQIEVRTFRATVAGGVPPISVPGLECAWPVSRIHVKFTEEG